MFGSLIRRKEAPRPLGDDNLVFESTTFTLTTAVPRPTERRSDDRVMAMLRVAKATHVTGGEEQLIRVCNVSAGGLMAEVGRPVAVGDEVVIELSSQKFPSTVVWTREGTAGFKFAQNIDLGELLAGRSIRPPYGGHPRVFIWGLLEARLQQADLMILGGLNEGVWPGLPAPDPWLAPKIRSDLGLPGLEYRIGLAAHDFASALGSREVLITRAKRDGRSPTVASAR